MWRGVAGVDSLLASLVWGRGRGHQTVSDALSKEVFGHIAAVLAGCLSLGERRVLSSELVSKICGLRFQKTYDRAEGLDGVKWLSLIRLDSVHQGIPGRCCNLIIFSYV